MEEMVGEKLEKEKGRKSVRCLEREQRKADKHSLSSLLKRIFKRADVKQFTLDACISRASHTRTIGKGFPMRPGRHSLCEGAAQSPRSQPRVRFTASQLRPDCE